MFSMHRKSTWQVVNALVSVVVRIVFLFKWTGVGHGLDGEVGRGVKDNCQVSGLSTQWWMVPGPEVEETGEKQGLRRREIKNLVLDVLV